MSFEQSRKKDIIVSSSMFPSLKVAEKVKFIPCNYKKTVSGDVVVFKSGDKLIAHRLVFRKNFVAVTKGDNRADCDRPISVFKIKGVVEEKSSKRVLWYYFFRNKLRKIRFLRFLLRPLKRFFRF